MSINSYFFFDNVSKCSILKNMSTRSLSGDEIGVLFAGPLTSSSTNQDPNNPAKTQPIMNYLNLTQTVIENVATAQKQFIDGVVESTKTFTLSVDATPFRRGLKATEGILLSGINAQSDLANTLAKTITSIDNIPARAANATKSVEAFAQKVYSMEGKVVKNTFETIERYIPSTGEGSFLGALSTPAQTALDLTKKAIDLPGVIFKSVSARFATVEAETEDAAKKTARAVKKVAKKVAKKAAK